MTAAISPNLFPPVFWFITEVSMLTILPVSSPPRVVFQPQDDVLTARLAWRPTSPCGRSSRIISRAEARTFGPIYFTSGCRFTLFLES